MTRYWLTPVLWMCLMLASSQVLAKASTIATAGDDTVISDNLSGEEEGAAPPSKPTAKPASQGVPAKGKQQTQGREQGNGKPAPRWHRFIPGMIR